ncbi:MAG: hypothetical protein KME13_08830 [Myxacorys californica WJT36-NPBG1]|jgi:hypothetical protein|nr:hypothetical protein [Myxacorys californica WJT36-NPBG1]
MRLKIHQTCRWASLLSCGFILFGSTQFRAAASPASGSTPISGLKLAQFNIRLPSIGIPGVPAVEGIIKGAIADQITQAMGRTLQTEAPIVSSAQALFPTVATLPGRPFRATGDLRPIGQQIRTSRDGTVLLAPGDYAIPVNVFCMKHAASSPPGHRYLLAPLKGKMADVIVALNSRTVGLNLPHPQLQVLSWNLQAGMKYEEMTPELRAIVDLVLPDFKPRLRRSFLEQIDASWSQLSSTVPGLPSMDSSLNRLGDVGRTVVTLKQTRETLLRYGNNYESLSRALVTQNVRATSGNTPWSRVSDRVYARMITQGNYSTPAELQVRVVPASGSASTAPVQIASSQGIVSAQSAASPVPVNLTNLVADPQNAGIQPLSTSPQPPKPDKKEDEDESGSGTLQLNGEGFTGPQSPPQGLPQS